MNTRFFGLLTALLYFLSCGQAPPPATSPEPNQETPSAVVAQVTENGPGPLTVSLSDTVVRPKVKRFGMNLTQYENWGTGQILANRLARNPSFEGSNYRVVVEVRRKTEGGFADEGPCAWEDGFWEGAQYEVVWGRALGRTGTVTASRKGANAYEYQCSDAAGFEIGDRVVLRKFFPEPTAGWWTRKAGQAQFLAEPNDLRPGSLGRQSLRMRAEFPGDRLELASYFDEPRGDRANAPLAGPQHLRFWAKALRPQTRLALALSRKTLPNQRYLDETITLSEVWQEVVLPFVGPAETQPGTVEFTLRLEGGDCLIDDVALMAEADSAGFRPEVPALLAEFQPGILRYWAGQLGDSLASQLSADGTMGLSGFSRWSMEPKVIGYSLPTFLALCAQLKAEAWYILPLTFTAEERADLIEYLAGPATSKMGQLRAAQGFAEPWTQILPKIHVELGNEAWNGIFKGGNLEDPKVYGEVAHRFIGEMVAKAGAEAGRFQWIVGSQAVVPARSKQVLSSRTKELPTSLALAPYLLHKLDRGTPADHLAALMTEVAGLETQGYLNEHQQVLEGAPLAIYEVNLHTTQGSADQTSLLQVTPSAAAGVAVACHMLNALALWNVRDQCFYNLNQFDYARSDTRETVRLWGAVRDLDPLGRKRPQFLALQLVNEALIGDMVQVKVQGQQKPFQSIASPLRVYGFRDGKRHALVAINLDATQATTFQLVMEQGVSGSRARLVAPSPNATNEEMVQVTLAREDVAMGPAPLTVTLDPAGLAVYQWSLP